MFAMKNHLFWPDRGEVCALGEDLSVIALSFAECMR